MQFRRRGLSLAACGLTAMVIVPTLAFGAADPAATIEARDDGTGVSNWFQDGSQASKDDSSVTIKAGESVRFVSVAPASGNSQFHNVSFKNSALKPASCTLPGIKQHPWEGSCTFTEVGTYTFLCEVHAPIPGGSAGMTGTVIVEKAPDPTPIATATPVVTASPQPTVAPAPTASPTPVPVPQAKPSAGLDAPSKPKVASFVKSGLKLTGPCASITSGKVTLTVTKAVAKKLKLKSTTLGTGTGRCDDGFFSVTVKPSAAVKKALKKHKGAVSATATLTASGIKPATRKLTLK